MSKRRLDVGIENVNEVYDGPGGILWEMLMGEEIHVEIVEGLTHNQEFTKIERVFPVVSSFFKSHSA